MVHFYGDHDSFWNENIDTYICCALFSLPYPACVVIFQLSPIGWCWITLRQISFGNPLDCRDKALHDDRIQSYGRLMSKILMLCWIFSMECRDLFIWFSWFSYLLQIKLLIYEGHGRVISHLSFHQTKQKQILALQITFILLVLSPFLCTIFCKSILTTPIGIMFMVDVTILSFEWIEFLLISVLYFVDNRIVNSNTISIIKYVFDGIITMLLIIECGIYSYVLCTYQKRTIYEDHNILISILFLAINFGFSTLGVSSVMFTLTFKWRLEYLLIYVDIYQLLRKLYACSSDLRRLQHLTHSINTTFRTVENTRRDTLCLSCMRNMKIGKQLHCGHLVHENCLWDMIKKADGNNKHDIYDICKHFNIGVNAVYDSILGYDSKEGSKELRGVEESVFGSRLHDPNISCPVCNAGIYFG